MATDDDRVAKALRLIRERACDGLRVAEVLRHVCLSRTALEPRFKQVLGRTIHQEMRPCDWSGSASSWRRPTCRSSGLPKPPATGTRST